MSEPVVQESVAEQVSAAMDGAAETTPATPTENASSQEVKTEQAVPAEAAPAVSAEQRTEVVDKESEQIKNLNTALAIERDERKRLKEELEAVKPVLEKMKNAFVPEVAPVEPATEQTEAEKFEAWYAQKEAEKAAELESQKLQATIKEQIESLTTEWNGENGKPKYSDDEVFKWQRENKKEYLTPEEAFFAMKRDDIIDWKARQTVASAPAPVSSERASWISTDHAPSTTTPKTDQEIKNAVLEALSSME